MVAIDAEDHVGGLRYVGPRFGGFSKGQVSQYDEVVYYYLEHDHEFPRDSVIPVDDIRQAVKEFLASGGECPTCIQWQQDKL
jgi:Immunity protein Imm1